MSSTSNPTLSIFQLVRELGTGLELDVLECLYEHHDSKSRYLAVVVIQHLLLSGRREIAATMEEVEAALTKLIEAKWLELYASYYRLTGAAWANIDLLNAVIANQTIYVREAA